MPEYQHLTRDQLMRLALERDQLTDEAQIALDAEISNRRITSSDIAFFKTESLAAQAEQDRKIESLSVSSSHVGRKFFGRKNLTHDPSRRIEEYDTTLWLLCGSQSSRLVATALGACFVVAGHFCISDQFHVLQKFPQRDWEHILVTWIKATVVLFVLRFAAPVVLRYFVYR